MSNDTNKKEMITEQAAPETAEPKKGKKPRKKGKFSNMLHNKKFKHGSMSTVMIVVVVVVAILLNIGAGALVDRFPSLNMDLTSDKRLSLSEKSEEVAQNVQNDTKIIFLATQETLENYYGDQATRFIQLAAKLAEVNGKISVEYVDLEKNPGFLSQYEEADSLDMLSVIVESPKRHKILSIEGDLMEYSSTDQAWYNNADAAFASALLMVNSEKLPVVTFTTGSGEQDYSSLMSYLQDNNFDCNELNLLTAAEVPEETDVLVLNAPSHDLTQEQIAVLDDYLSTTEDDANHLLVTFNPSQAADMPNLKAFMEDWGIGVQTEASYILESDSNRYVRVPQLPLLQIDEEGLLSSLADLNKPVVATAIVQLEKLFDYQSGVTVSDVITTYDTAFGVPAGVDENWEPEESSYKSFPVLTYSTSGTFINGVFQGASVTACASSDLLNSFLSQSSFGNAESVLNLFRYLTNTTDTSEDIYITPVEVSQNNITMTASQVTTYGLVIFTIILPLAVLIVGFVMWLRRRHL